MLRREEGQITVFVALLFFVLMGVSLCVLEGMYSFSESALAESAIKAAESIGKGGLPVCIAKTQYSFSDDMKKLGRPTGFTLTVNDLEVRGGAEFLVAVCGSIMLMPGLGKKPAALNMGIDDTTYEIKGLF